MNYNEFAEKIKTKYPQYKDMDNRELATKMVAKYPQYNDVTFDNNETVEGRLAEIQIPQEEQSSPMLQGQVTKSVNLTPSGIAQGIAKNISAALASPVTAIKNKISLPEAFKQKKDEFTQYENEHPEYFDRPLRNFATDTAVYSLLPAANFFKGSSAIGKLGNLALTGGYQGALIGGLESLKNKGLSSEDNVSDAAGSALLGAALPVTFHGLGRGAQNVIENPSFQNKLTSTLEGLTSVPKKYLDLALKKELNGNSIFKGKFDPETAYRPIEQKLKKAKTYLPTSESFSDKFYEVGQKAKQGLEKIKTKAGQDVNAALSNLNPDEINANGLRVEIQNLIDSYANGGEINPALIRAKNEIQQINDLLGNKSKEQINNELINYLTDVRKNSGLETSLNKEQEDIAFNILAQATGKNKNWLKSQLKANLPQLSTQKRQEFIQNLLENTDDKIEVIDPAWRQYFPELTFENVQSIGGGQKIVSDMFDKIMGKNFRTGKTFSPDELAYNDAEIMYNNLLADVIQNPSESAYTKAYNDINNVVKNLDDYGKNLFFERLGTDLDNIENIINPKIKPIDLHNIKEILYDIANYENAGGIRNSTAKGLADKINQYLRKLDTNYAAANDNFALIKNVEHDLGGVNGINSNTIGGKLSKYGTESNLESGLDRRLRNIDRLLNPEDRFLNDTKNLVSARNDIAEINRLIGSSTYERNPRLLGNINDIGREEALNKLQRYSQINFMDDLDAIRAREALERFTPGQGGGSGSSQGFQNLLRSGITTTTGGAIGGLLGGPMGTLGGLFTGAALVSPKIMGQGTIKNLGSLYQALGQEVPQWLTPLILNINSQN